MILRVHFKDMVSCFWVNRLIFAIKMKNNDIRAVKRILHTSLVLSAFNWLCLKYDYTFLMSPSFFF